jgi:hypothetical protein
LKFLKNYDSEQKRKNYYVSRLQSKKHRLEAYTSIKNEQFELAIEQINNAISLSSETNSERMKNSNIILKNQVKSFLAEIEGNFKKASGIHGEIREISNKKPLNTFHKVRRKICLVKHHIVKMEIDEARKIIDEIEEEFGLRKESRDLSVLIEAIIDYDSGLLSDIDQLFDKFYSDEEEEHIIDYGEDYKPAIINLLAAQRFKKQNIDEELLDQLIKISIKDVLVPKHAENLVKEVGVENIDLADKWQENIPVHIIRDLERTEMRESMDTGDSSDIAMKIMTILEKNLELYVEYYGKQVIGEDWKNKLTTQDKEELSLGDLVSFFEKYDNKKSWKKAGSLFSEKFFEGKNIVELRNDLQHGRISKIDREEYMKIKEHVLEIIEEISIDSPVAGKILSKNDLNIHSVRLYWGKVRKSVWIQTEAELEEGEIYYFSREDINDEQIISLENTNVEKCEEERTIKNLTNLEA